MVIKMTKTDKADEIVNKILEDIDNLSGKKAILVKQVFMRIGITVQYLYDINQYFENTKIENMNLDEVYIFLNGVNKEMGKFQEYMETTTDLIEDFNKQKVDKQKENKIVKH